MTEWQVVRLDEIATVERGKFSARPRNDPKYYGGNIPFLQTGDVATATGIILNYSQTLNEEGLKVSRLFPAGTLLITIAANIGDIAEVGFDFACPDSLVAIRPKDGVNKDWLKYFLQTQKSYFESRATQNAQANINLQTIKPLKVNIPAFPEQTAIADLLSTWDAAIEKTEKLIAAKREQRKGLMQQLLSGKQRFPRFDMPWQQVRLGQVFSNRTESERTDLPLVSITGTDGVIFRDKLERKDTSSANKGKYLRVCPDDIGYNTMRMWQGVSGLSQIEGIVSPAYTIATPGDSLVPEFMALLFKFPPIVHLFYRYSQGLVSDTWNLKFRHFSEIRVRIPEKKEQEAIAVVFQPVDKELGLLHQQLGAYKKQKRGLMQKLLTGEWRVGEGRARHDEGQARGPAPTGVGG